jgi:hypothetical protein
VFVAGILVSAVEMFVNPGLFQQIDGVYTALVPILNLIFFGTMGMGTAFVASKATYAVGKRTFPAYFVSSVHYKTKVAERKKAA